MVIFITEVQGHNYNNYEVKLLQNLDLNNNP